MRKNHKWTTSEMKKLISKPDGVKWREWLQSNGYGNMNWNLNIITTRQPKHPLPASSAPKA